MTLKEFKKITIDIEQLENDIIKTAKSIDTIKEYGTLDIQINTVNIYEEFESKLLVYLFQIKLKEYKDVYEQKIKEINEVGLEINSRFKDEFWKECLKEVDK